MKLAKTRYAVIADDVTGAMDTGLQVLKCGCSAIVILDAKDYSGNMISRKNFGDEFTIINTNTRGTSRQEAFEKVTDIAKPLRQTKLELVYKKIDSTMRGNIGAEIKALLQTGLATTIVMTPAIPSRGTVVVNGLLLVNSVLIEKTTLADDPVSKINDSYIANIISSQFDGKISVLSRTSPAEISMAIEDGIANNTKLFVIDANTTKDLANIVRSTYNHRQSLLLCGSAGLFEQYIRLSFAGDKAGKDRYRPALSRQNKDKPVLVVSGSMNKVTHQQIDYLSENLSGTTELVECDVKSIGDKKITSQLAELIRENLKKGMNVILVPTAAKLGEHLGPAAVVEWMAGILSTALQGGIAIAGYVCVGGDTCYHCLHSLGVQAIRLVGELEPYVPIGRLVEGPFDNFPVITKAGGFGQQSVLLDGINYLKGL